MILTVFHQLHFILSIGFGLPFSPNSLEKLVAAARATIEEFGSLGDDGDQLVGGAPLDAEMMRDLQLHRLRAAARAAAETPYYHDLFRRLGIDPRKMILDDLARIPITPKIAVRDHPDDFVRPSAKPFLRAMTTGTTGIPTSIYFSQREMRVYAALTALGMLTQRTLNASDIVQISVSARGALGNLTLAGGAMHVGALVYQTGVVSPEIALEHLKATHRLPGKKAQASLLYTYPSYLGALVETGLAMGLRPADFGLERISVGGEIVTEGLQARARALFGDINYEQNYGLTELWGMSGAHESGGQLGFEPSQGLVEVIDPESGQPAAPGQIGTLVGTPFPPYRETTMLLRYDTEDLVTAFEPIPGKQRCGDILGKKRLALRHNDGSWTPPRAVIEALERCEVVPLPARFTFYAQGNGVGIEVITRTQTASAHRQLEASLEGERIRLQELRLCASPDEFTRPAYPLRGDRREVMFDDLLRTEMTRL